MEGTPLGRQACDACRPAYLLPACLQSQKRRRSYFRSGKCELEDFKLNQDVPHWLYRTLFNLIDLHNRARHGEVTAIWDVWSTKSWEVRIFMSVLAIIFVNVTMLYALYHPETETNTTRADNKKIPQHERNRRLARALIENPLYHIPSNRTTTRADATADLTKKCNHFTMIIPEKKLPPVRAVPARLGRNGRKAQAAKPARVTNGRRQLVCKICTAKKKAMTPKRVWKALSSSSQKVKTRYMCSCGVPVCVKAGTTCYHEHMSALGF